MKIRDFVSMYDPQNQFDVLINTYKQIEFAWLNQVDLKHVKGQSIKNVVISGLGGSAIAGDLLQNFLKDEIKIPISVNRNYFLPAFVNEDTLLIVSSYSGNTEETIETLNEGLKRKAKIVCITTGGEIEKIAKENNLPIVKLQKGFQPRYALGLSFFSQLKTLQEAELVSPYDGFVLSIIRSWKEKGKEFSIDENPAYNYAEQLIGYIPIIYSVADSTSAVGMRMKCQLNENSKMKAFHNVFPELNHNEIVGWETFNPDKMPFKVVILLDKDYHPQIKKRIEVTTNLLKKSGADVITIENDLPTYKERILDLLYITDWITYYTALLNGKDPSEIDNINTLKKEIAR
ncbi:MAG TPA: bifunctional phosphoglucose/phosphomannose isomerase [Ignavibacteriaceae bacterium]|nr:bifunctional phosphoglucose/phosphomannose isomerase [Ignavibacteriaceae bacterium]